MSIGRKVFLLIAVLVLAATASNARIQAMFVSRDGFDPSPGCDGLWIDPALSVPQDACDRVTEVRRDVAASLGLNIEAPSIYLVGDFRRFGRLLGLPGSRATGAVFMGDVFLSPRAFSNADWTSIVAHELIHASWRAHLGSWDYQRLHPLWFREGLAVFLSNGGGAERASETEAIQQFRAGRRLIPEGRGRRLLPATPAESDLSYPVFYRQSAMFVAYLARQPEQFESLLHALRQSESLENAVMVSHGRSIAELWKGFVSSLLDDVRDDQSDSRASWRPSELSKTML